MPESQEYNVNFFKPVTKHTRANMWLVIIMVLVWAVGVFGFQFLLIALNEPTPEKSYTQFEKAWPVVIAKQDTNVVTKQSLSRVYLSVLGKNIAVKPVHKKVLKEALSSTVLGLMAEKDSVYKEALVNNPEEAVNLAKAAIGLKADGFDKLMADLLPTSLITVESKELSDANKAAIPGIMKLYLIHNQSALTDFKFLGFPFHYWYTAQFLLIMFVLLCLLYAYITDKENKKYGFVEE